MGNIEKFNITTLAHPSIPIFSKFLHHFLHIFAQFFCLTFATFSPHFSLFSPQFPPFFVVFSTFLLHFPQFSPYFFTQFSPYFLPNFLPIFCNLRPLKLHSLFQLVFLVLKCATRLFWFNLVTSSGVKQKSSDEPPMTGEHGGAFYLYFN